MTPTSSERDPSPGGFGSPQPAGVSRYLTTSMISTAAGSNIGDIFVDWAKTKPLTVAIQDNMEKVLSEEELRQKFPPPRRVFSDGIPTIVKDRYIDWGYDVYYTTTTEQQRLRKKVRSSQVPTLLMPKSYATFRPRSSGTGTDRTEPEIVRLIELLNYREFVQKEGQVVGAILGFTYVQRHADRARQCFLEARG